MKNGYTVCLTPCNHGNFRKMGFLIHILNTSGRSITFEENSRIAFIGSLWLGLTEYPAKMTSNNENILSRLMSPEVGSSGVCSFGQASTQPPSLPCAQHLSFMSRGGCHSSRHHLLRQSCAKAKKGSLSSSVHWGGTSF